MPNSSNHNRTIVAPTSTIILCGFSDGTITSWERYASNTQPQWKETILLTAEDSDCDGRAITDIGGIQYYGHGDNHNSTNSLSLNVIACSSGGAVQYHFTGGGQSLTATTTTTSETNSTTSTLQREKYTLLTTPANVVKYHTLQHNHSADTTLVLIGTAAPRHNKIHVFLDRAASHFTNDRVAATISSSNNNFHTDHNALVHCGSLVGHEDWITCFDWFHLTKDSTSLGEDYYLASGSQDARIRLWKFTATPIANSDTTVTEQPILESNVLEVKDSNGNEDDEDEDDQDEKDEAEMEEGESRLEINVGNTQISVFLEALLIGHEERVTSVAWHPNPKPIYGEDLILVSSSMDRSIFIWSELAGIWSPISRVGSAGGILGGSVGSSLLGFLNVQMEPNDGKWMVGHGYGGALHFFAMEQTPTEENSEALQNMTVEERASLAPWRAQPCLTGHFDSVTDLCWETNSGEYLLTVGNDQTCRVWASLPFTTEKDAPAGNGQAWIEIARPQVHGYDLSAVTSLSSPDHRHLLVSGADEKELRVFDATKSFNQLLGRIRNVGPAASDSTKRVERAYIPSLGLSNKATASEGAEQDSSTGVSESNSQLPLERDLGAESLWPEIRKLYGHNTELTRLTSTLTAKTAIQTDTISTKEILVASSAKARDVEAACIRLWNVSENRCVQILTGGHRSTVTAMAFSPDERFFVSSGKDRRLCVWERSKKISDDETPIWSPFALSCAKDVAHKRIVWGVHFCPFDSTIFASASRDGTVRVWKLSSNMQGASGEGTTLNELTAFSPKCCISSGKPESVTSLSFAPLSLKEGSAALVALGLENGMIELWRVGIGEQQQDGPVHLFSLPPELCHIDAVAKLAWQPMYSGKPAEGHKMILASSAGDHGCRIFEVVAR